MPPALVFVISFSDSAASPTAVPLTAMTRYFWCCFKTRRCAVLLISAEGLSDFGTGSTAESTLGFLGGLVVTQESGFGLFGCVGIMVTVFIHWAGTEGSRIFSIFVNDQFKTKTSPYPSNNALTPSLDRPSPDSNSEGSTTSMSARTGGCNLPSRRVIRSIV